MTSERKPTPPCSGNGSSPAGSATSSCSATKDQIKEIQDLIDQGKKQEAIDKAIKYYGIDTSKTKSVTYDPNNSGEAVTSPDGTVKVGDKAFSSPGWLGSSIGHEVEIHVNEQAMKGRWYTGPQGTALQEVQAYDYEISNAKRYGTTATDLADLQKRRTDYYNQLNSDYQGRADAHNYVMKPGEEGY
jgi:hypothetical protein